jgi:hypothetical protein
MGTEGCRLGLSIAILSGTAATTPFIRSRA